MGSSSTLEFDWEDEIFSSDLKTIVPALPEGYILWVLKPGNGAPATRIFYTASMEGEFDKVSGIENASFYVLSFKALDEFLYQFPDNTDIILTYVENNERLT